MCPHTAPMYFLVLLLCMCSGCCCIHPDATYVSSYCSYVFPRTAAMYVLTLLLYVRIAAISRSCCLHNVTYVSSCYYICVLILLCISSYCCCVSAHTAAIRAHRRHLLQVYLEGQGERGNAVITCLFFLCLGRGDL